MNMDLANTRTQLYLRETAFVVLVLAVLTIPWLLENDAVSWGALGALLAFGVVNPRSLLLAVPAAIGISFKPFEAGNMQLNVLEVLIAAAGVAYVPRIVLFGWRNWDQIRDYPGRFNSVIMPDRLGAGIALLLLLAGVVSLFTLADDSYARESLRLFRWTILFPVAYYFLAAPVLVRTALRDLTAGLFVAGAAAASIIAVIDGVAGGGIQADAVTRLSGMATHPNALALVLERGAILALLIGLLYRAQVSPPWLAAGSGIAFVTLLTFSRGGALALVVGCLAILLLTRAKRLAIVAGGIGVAVIVAMSVAVPERFLSLLGGGSGSLRLELWKSSASMIGDYPLTGVGLDQFLYQYLPRYVSPEAWPERFTSHPHNVILDSWLSLGIIGLLLIVLFATLWIRHVREALRNEDRLALAAGGAILGTTIHGMVDRAYFLPELAVSMWVLIMILRPVDGSGIKADDVQDESKG